MKGRGLVITLELGEQGQEDDEEFTYVALIKMSDVHLKDANEYIEGLSLEEAPDDTLVEALDAARNEFYTASQVAQFWRHVSRAIYNELDSR